jgi:SPP1 family predicted phage head-tail adaptor
MNQIRLERWESVKDVNGNWKENIVIKVNVFAEVTRSGGDRSSINGQTGLTNFFIFRMRFNPKIQPSGTWRVIYGGRSFTVHSIELEEQKRFWWVIKAKEKGE